MSLYLRELRKSVVDGKETISSTRLGKSLDIKAAQVRKDFTYFGHLGQVGVGYRCQDLIERIQKFLGTDRVWPVALIGCGNLGQALLGYAGFERQGFRITAAFDIAADMIGTTRAGITIRHIDELSAVTAEQGIRLAMLAVPASRAQATAEQAIAAGISGVLNFAPVSLVLPKAVSMVAVDLAIDLEQLSFGVVREIENR